MFILSSDFTKTFRPGYLTNGSATAAIWFIFGRTRPIPRVWWRMEEFLSGKMDGKILILAWPRLPIQKDFCTPTRLLSETVTGAFRAFRVGTGRSKTTAGRVLHCLSSQKKAEERNSTRGNLVRSIPRHRMQGRPTMPQKA